jgi:hypothetical protein
MDTRRDARSTEGRQSEPDLTDTGLVNVIDLQTVGDPGWRNRPVAIVVVAVAGILAVAAMAAALRPRGDPTPTVPAIGIASPSPVAPSLEATFPPPGRETRVPPTPRPTDPPPWAWNRVDFLPEYELNPVGIWVTRSGFLILAQQPAPVDGQRPSWLFAHSTLLRPWELVAAPPAIYELQGGSVIDERLWFIARVGGVTDERQTLELVSTSTGDDWETFGPSHGLGTVDGVALMGRVDDRWVAATWRYTGAGEGAGEMDLHWSADGVAWHSAALPETDSAPLFVGAAMLGDTMVALGEREVLYSTDGMTWQASPSTVPENYAPTGLACSDVACVIVASTFNLSGDVIARQTSDLQEWFGADVVAPRTETGDYLMGLTATDAGFLAIGAGTGYAFLSEDGLAWQSLQVTVAPSGTDAFMGLAVRGSDVVGLARGRSNEAPSIWTGTLPETGT